MARKQLGAAPSGDTDAATKKYVADTVANRVPARTAATASTSATSVTIDCATTDMVIWNGLSVNFTGSTGITVTSTPVENQTLTLRVTDNGTTKSFTAGGQFINSGVTSGLANTVAGKIHTIVYKYDSFKGKWVCMASDLVGY